MERLGLQREEAEKDILTVTGTDHEQLERGYWSGLKMLWRGEYRKRTSLALIMLGAAQLSGIDGVLYVRILFFIVWGLGHRVFACLKKVLGRLEQELKHTEIVFHIVSKLTFLC